MTVTEASPDFRDLFESELGYVMNTLRRLGIPSSDVADLAQEVFVTVHGLMDDYDPTRPLRPWLFGIAYRIARRHRALARHSREVGDAGIEPRDRAPLADAQMATEETRALVRTALDSIELSRRSMLILCDLDGFSAPEAAESLGIPLNTAYSRLRRGREELTQAIHRLRARGK
jgi:RNA polymerase sigma-70 factor (ECF subfamily)